MAFKSAGGVTVIVGGVSTLNYTVPASVVATDTVLFAYSWPNSTASSVSVGVPSGATTGTIVASRNDSNMGWGIVSVTGVVTGDTVSLTFSSTSGSKAVQAFVFSAPVGVVGSVGSRGGTSQATTAAPALSGSAIGVPVLVFGIERTTATGTVVSGVAVSTSESVTNLAFQEQTADPATSYYLGRFTPTTSPSGAATITYSGASGNGAAVLIAEIAGAPTTPSISPSFTGLTTGRDFSAAVVVPGAPAAFKAASPMIKSVSPVVMTAPAGTVPGDYVYALVAWPNSILRNPIATSRTVTMVVPPRADGNLGWFMVRATGMSAGDTLGIDLDGSGQVAGKLFVFDQALSPAGSPGSRGSSLATVVAPAVPVEAAPSYVFAVERTLVDGTVVTNAVNSLGLGVTQVAFEETPDDPDVSMYLGQVAATTGSTSGATTLTYNSASGNAGAVTIPTVSGAIAIEPSFGSNGRFTLEVAPAAGLVRSYLGRPSSDTIRVKAVTSAIGITRLACSTQSDMSSPVFSANTTPVGGYSSLQVAGLAPDTEYWWRIECDGLLTGPTNKTRTFPLEGQPYPRFAILAGACTKGFGNTASGLPSNSNTFTAMRTKLDALGVPARLWIDLGDDIYPCASGSPNGTVFPENESIIRGWWEAQHQQSERKAFHAAIPTAHVWSDNDFIGSNSDSTLNPTVQSISTSVRRKVLCDGPFGSTDDKGLYWSARIGRILLVVTDGRSYMSNVLLPNNTPGKSMLGATQKAWLFSQFSRTDHSGIIWFHDNQWVGAPGVSSSRPGIDNWQAFSAERDEIAAYITSNDVKLLLLVHADNHATGFDNGTNNPYGHFPFYLCAPVYQDAQPFTQPLSGQTWPTANLGNQKYFGWLEIQDDGNLITVDITTVDVTVTGTPVNRVTAKVTAAAAPITPRRVHEFFENIHQSDIYPPIGTPTTPTTPSTNVYITEDPNNSDLLVVIGDVTQIPDDTSNPDLFLLSDAAVQVSEDPSNTDLLIIGDN